jgi:hypothetical protein
LLKDQRAARLGDVLTVDVQFSDSATLENETSRERSNSDALNLGNLFGYASKIAGTLPGNPTLNTTAALGSSGSGLFKGTGSAQRKESVRLKVAVVIVDQLRNGNFVVSGRQELRVNNELREVVVGGIVRPQDIDAENTIASEKIAARRLPDRRDAEALLSAARLAPLGSPKVGKGVQQTAEFAHKASVRLPKAHHKLAPCRVGSRDPTPKAERTLPPRMSEQQRHRYRRSDARDLSAPCHARVAEADVRNRHLLTCN